MASQRESIGQLADALRQSIARERRETYSSSGYLSAHISSVEPGKVCVPGNKASSSSHDLPRLLSWSPRPPLRSTGVDLHPSTSSPSSFRHSCRLRFQFIIRSLPAQLLLLFLRIPLSLERASSRASLEISTVERTFTLVVVLLSFLYLSVTINQPADMAQRPGQRLYARADAFLEFAGLPLLESTIDTLDHLPQFTPLTDYTVSSGYGRRLHPITYRSSFHHGVDLAAEEGSPIFPPGRGRIAETGVDRGYGVFVVVDHAPAPYRTLLGHLQSHNVAVGEVVRPTREIAQVGSSGQSTGPHLHYQIYGRSGPVDPEAVLRRASVLRDSLARRLSRFDFHIRSHVAQHPKGSYNAALYHKALKERLSPLMERISSHYPSTVTAADSIAIVSSPGAESHRVHRSTSRSSLISASP